MSYAAQQAATEQQHLACELVPQFIDAVQQISQNHPAPGALCWCDDSGCWREGKSLPRCARINELIARWESR